MSDQNEYIVFKRGTFDEWASESQDIAPGAGAAFARMFEVTGVKVIPDVNDADAEKLAKAHDAVHKLADAMASYRNTLIQHGFSAETADQMAAQAQAALIQRSFGQATREQALRNMKAGRMAKGGKKSHR
jgi:hypothetical protein